MRSSVDRLCVLGRAIGLPRPLAWIAACAAIVASLSAPAALGDDPRVRVRAPTTPHEPELLPVERPPEEADYNTTRFEPAGFPLLGGDSDIGFQFGGVATLTSFDQGIRPYKWNMDLLLTASVKNDPTGPEIAQQNYLWQWDVPALMHGRLRLNPLIAYERTVNQGYFGLGNASPGLPPPGANGRYFQFIHAEGRVRELVRVNVRGPWDLMIAPAFRYVAPGVYEGSRLAADTTTAGGSAPVFGVRSLVLASAGAGVIYDTRDNEIFPRRGLYHQVGLKYVAGLPLEADVHYAQASAVFAEYIPLGREGVLALRQVADWQIGHVPFYDLFTGGPFITLELPGGAQGVRGVPVGRYLGPIKGVVNAEVRSLFTSFHILGQSFHVGGDVFADAGRVWTDDSSRLDGTGPGLKFGLGGGAYLLWGQAALFRIEVAYSPDAVAENPGFPVGIYVADGTMF